MNRFEVASQLASALVILLASSCDFNPSSPGPSLDEKSNQSSSSLTSLGAGAALTAQSSTDCARSPGFWCQNRDGKNPNLQNFPELAEEAGTLLAGVGIELSIEEIGDAVCETRRQLLRHIVTLALNLAAGYVSESDGLVGEEYATVGDAFQKAADVYLMGDALPASERNAIKDVLDRINNNQNLANGCTADEEEDGEEGEEGGGDEGTGQEGGEETTGNGRGNGQTECQVEPDGKITICHVPPGNPNNKNTIRISPSAWAAHKAHGDTCGPCAE